MRFNIDAVKNPNNNTTSGGSVVIGGGGSDYIHPTGNLWGNTYTGVETLDGDITSSGTVKSTNIETQNGNIDSLNSNGIVNTGIIQTKNLKVTGRAEFFELVVDQIKSIGGAQILSPADGFTIDYVYNDYTYHYLYWLASDGDNETTNKWVEGDQALCMNFDDANSTYYWALVQSTGTTDQNQDGEWIDVELGMYDGGEHKTYHFIEIDDDDCDGVITPEVGQSIVQLGNRHDRERQSAIYMSSFDGLDTYLKAPFYAQYMGIDDYDLDTHRQSYFDANGAKFTGDFSIGGQSSQTYIENKIIEELGKEQDLKFYTYFKYSSLPNGAGVVSDSDGPGMNYIGMLVSTNPVKPNNVTLYTWRYKGDTADYYSINDVGSHYYVDKAEDGRIRCYVNLNSVVVKYSATGASIVSELPSSMEVRTFTDSNSGSYLVEIGENNIFSYTGEFAYREGVTSEYYGMKLQDLFSEEIYSSFSCPLQIIPQAVFNIEQGLDAKIQLKVNSADLAQTGIDIESRKITVTANNFTIQNNNGSQTMKVSSDGSLTTTASDNKQVVINPTEQSVNIKGPVDEGTDANGNATILDGQGLKLYSNQSQTLIQGGVIIVGNINNQSHIEIDAETGIRCDQITLVDQITGSFNTLFMSNNELILQRGDEQFVIQTRKK